MKVSSGHWYAVLSSRELRRKPVGKVRFSERLVFWRDAADRVMCLEDRCPHRGAALSLGRVTAGVIACPYHGFRFEGDGRCVRVPVEGTWHIPDHLRVKAYPVREEQGYVWLWRGPAMAAADLPPVPRQPIPDGTIFGECTQVWPAHYTRCIEGVIDHSHVPFVHTKTLGLFIRDPVMRIRVTDIDDGFRASLVIGEQVRHFVDLTYPNLWTQPLKPTYAMSATFAPVDDTRTEVYLRWYHTWRAPVFRPFVNLWGRLGNYLVFAEDMAVLASQQPANVDDARNEKLVPSDAAQMAYRKLRGEHQEEKRRFERLTQEKRERQHD